ncbi:MAG: type III pantothenate kinase [bacterium]
MSSTRLLAVDIGNTSTDIALFEDSQLRKHVFLPSTPSTYDRLGPVLDPWQAEGRLDQAILASVVPPLTPLMVNQIENRLGLTPIRVEDFKTRLLPLRVDYPESVGVDRVVNCYAAIHLYDLPAIVISLGTATTFEALSAAGEYLGGAIAPGVKISLEALTSRAVLLPEIHLEKPGALVAANSVEQIQSGVYFGALAMIEGMVMRMQPRLGGRARVIGTGGISSLFAGENLFDHHEPMLTLKGLELIHRRHCSNLDHPAKISAAP